MPFSTRNNSQPSDDRNSPIPVANRAQFDDGTTVSPLTVNDAAGTVTLTAPAGCVLVSLQALTADITIGTGDLSGSGAGNGAETLLKNVPREFPMTAGQTLKVKKKTDDATLEFHFHMMTTS